MINADFLNRPGRIVFGVTNEALAPEYISKKDVLVLLRSFMHRMHVHAQISMRRAFFMKHKTLMIIRISFVERINEFTCA